MWSAGWTALSSGLWRYMDAHLISGVLPHSTTPHPYFALPLLPLDPVCHYWPLDWLLFLLLPMLLLQLLLWTLPAQIIGARRGLLCVPRGSWGADQDWHGKRWSKMRTELVGVPLQAWPSMRFLTMVITKVREIRQPNEGNPKDSHLWYLFWRGWKDSYLSQLQRKVEPDTIKKKYADHKAKPVQFVISLQEHEL